MPDRKRIDRRERNLAYIGGANPGHTGIELTQNQLRMGRGGKDSKKMHRTSQVDYNLFDSLPKAITFGFPFPC